MTSFRAAVVVVAACSLVGCVRPCVTNRDCDDGAFCNGEETCVAERCVAGTTPNCDDGLACTRDLCVEQQRRCVSSAPDLDDDGVGAASCLDADGEPLGSDCDDNNPEVFAGNVERCTLNDIDNDCDPTTLGGRDLDGDGFESAVCHNDLPDGGENRGTDCNDIDETIHPGQAEVCNYRDDNCNGQVDEGVSSIRFKDDDNDGWGTGPGAQGCVVPFTSHLGTDCDDSNPAIHPGQFRCLGPQGAQYELCTVDGGFVTGTCPGQSCRPQPNGTGFCL